jgi:hypothetical protein
MSTGQQPTKRKEVEKMKEMIKNIGETAVTKMRIINRVRKDGEYADNLRKCPTYSEFYGMIQTLKCMGILNMKSNGTPKTSTK